MTGLKLGLRVFLILAFTQAASADPCTILDALDGVADGNAPPAGATCSAYLTTASKTGIACHWTFPYRSADATAFAEDIWLDIARCRTGETLEADQRVNHPDSYDLRTWQSGDVAYSVSVKDKAALGSTLVFIKAEPAPPEASR